MGWGPDRLCQTSPIPRSPDGDNNIKSINSVNSVISVNSVLAAYSAFAISISDGIFTPSTVTCFFVLYVDNYY